MKLIIQITIILLTPFLTICKNGVEPELELENEKVPTVSIYSETFQIAKNILNGEGESWLINCSYKKNVDSLTQIVYNEGIIDFCYEYGTWNKLPYKNFGIEFEYIYRPGEIIISFEGLINRIDYEIIPNMLRFKLVLIYEQKIMPIG